MAQSPEYPDLPFVPPKAFGRGRDGYRVQYIVVHYTAGSERSSSAEDGAAYDARRTDGVSTHYFVDQDSTVQCVLTSDRANAAFQYGNRLGIQYELCGTVQTRAQWLDAASEATLTRAARQMARDCVKYGLPVRRLTVAQMRAGERGLCGHVDVTDAYGLGDHRDPGAEFPWDVLLSLVSSFVNGEDVDPNIVTALLGGSTQSGYLEVPSNHDLPEWAKGAIEYCNRKVESRLNIKLAEIKSEMKSEMEALKAAVAGLPGSTGAPVVAEVDYARIARETADALSQRLHD